MNATPATTTTSPARRIRPETLLGLGWGRWRVLDAMGGAIGLIEEDETPSGSRFRALRYRWSSRAFISVGEFWSIDDAVAALRSA